MSEAKRLKYVSFRVTDEEYTQIERAAVAAGDEPNNWCRNTVLTASREGPLFGETGRLIYRARGFAVPDGKWTADLV